MRVVYRPLYERETVMLLDIYIDGKWIGSRRTLQQAAEAVRNYVYR